MYTHICDREKKRSYWFMAQSDSTRASCRTATPACGDAPRSLHMCLFVMFMLFHVCFCLFDIIPRSPHMLGKTLSRE